MREKTLETIKYEILKLSKEAQEAINFVDWQKISGEIGMEYLAKEEIDNFQKEVALVLIGEEYLFNLSRNIKENIGVSEPDANKMADEIMVKIFEPIADKVELLIKSKIAIQSPSWDKTVNFIVSGGNYSCFI